MKIDDNNKLLLKILSCVIAIILWIGITYTEDPIISQTLNGINIIFEGEDALQSNGLILTNKDSLPDISAVIRGNRSSVISSMGSITAAVDVSGIKTTGQNIVSLKYNYPINGITLVKGKIQEITLETEKIVSRNIPVRIETENQDKNEECIVNAYSSEENLRIRGAESEVYKIAYARALVDVSGITKTGSQGCMYKFYDEKGEIVPDKNIIYRSHHTVNVNTEAYKRITVPIKAVLDEKLSESYELDLKSISMQTVDAGMMEDKEISEIEAVITSENETQAEIKLSVPDGIYIPEKNRIVKVTYQLLPKVLEELEISVEAVNVPEGKNVTISPQKIKVSVKGAENNLSVDKVRAEIDASELEYGDNTVTAEVTAEENISVIGTYTVTAKLE